MKLILGFLIASAMYAQSVGGSISQAGSGGGGGSGTVTSVGLSIPGSLCSITGTPVTTTGTLTCTFPTGQTAQENQVLSTSSAGAVGWNQLTAAMVGSVPTGINGGAFPTDTDLVASNGSGQPVSSGIAPANVALKSTLPPSLIAGASAIYLFTDGSGSTLTDSSGNGNNGTITGATWTNGEYLTFTSFPTSFVSIPKTVWSGGQTFQIWFNQTSMINIQDGQSYANMAVLMGSDNSSNDIRFWSATPGMAGFAAGGVYPNSSTQSGEKFTGPSSMSWSLGSPVAWYKNGQVSGFPIQTANVSAFTATTNFYLGNSANAGYQTRFPFLGSIYAFVVYPSVLTPSQIAANESAMRAYLLATKGIAIKDNINYETNTIAVLGDSIVAGGNPSGYAVDFQQTFFGKLSSYFPSSEMWNFGVSGDTAANMAGQFGRITTQVKPLVNRFSQAGNVVFMEGGTNDINPGNATAATIYANIKLTCTDANAFNSACVVGTIMAASRNSGPQETVRQTLNQLIVAGYLSGDLGAVGLADYGDDPIMGVALNDSNLNYFVDNVHPTPAGTKIMANRAALAIQSATAKQVVSMVIPIIVPRGDLVATSANTGSIPIVQLGSNQKVCGVTIKPLSPSKGGTLTVATMSVGDSLGSSTQYAPAYSIFSAASNTNFQDTTVWNSASYAGGVVTAYFSTITDNVNAAFTDLVVDGTTNTKVTSASYTFVAADAGTDIYISAGSGFTVGSYHVNSVSAGAAILDRSPAAVSTTGGSYILGEIAVDLCVVTAP